MSIRSIRHVLNLGGRSYEDALLVLESRKRAGRPKASQGPDGQNTPARTKTSSSGTLHLRGSPGIAGMRDWLHQLGHSEADLNKLNVIHVAGTKGKGSTCAFIESLLRAHGQRAGFPRKTGLYTSPMLIKATEVIRINSQPIQPELFAQYFFEICDKLPQLLKDYDASASVVERGPRHLQLNALLALHVFIRENIDVAIFETHCGGEYDATNVVPAPLVTAVTTLGMDHIDMLGPTIENIAWHKSGIYKSGSAALSTTQAAAPLAVLEQRALSKGETLRVVDIDPRLPPDAVQVRPLVQKKNASLAIAAAEAFLDRFRSTQSSEQHLSVQDIDQGIRAFAWPGRFHIVPDGQRTWFLDAAHNDMSVEVAAQWFAEVSRDTISEDESTHHNNDNTTRVLIFSHDNELRDAATLLKQLALALRAADSGIQYVVFSTCTDTKLPRPQGDTKTTTPWINWDAQFDMFRQVWAEVFPEMPVWHEETVSDAMDRVQGLQNKGSDLHVLITGSQHLVGPALRILDARGVKI